MSNPVNEYDDLKEYMINELPGVSDGLLLQQLRQAGRNFCIETEAWVETLTAIDVVEDQTEYSINTGYNASIQRIIKIEYDDSELTESQYSFDGDRTLTLEFEPAENITDGLVLEVVLRPNMSSNELPEWFMERYAEGIMAYAFKELMSMQNKPWANQFGMQKYAQKYEKIRQQAFMEKFISFKRGGELRVQMRNW